MSISSKIIHVTILWLSILLTSVIVTDSPAIRILLLLMAAGVTVHLLTIKTAIQVNRSGDKQHDLL